MNDRRDKYRPEGADDGLPPRDEDMLERPDSGAAGQPAGEAPPPSPDEEVVRALTAERDDLLARLQRLAADYQNYQKRIAREVDQGREYANAELIKALVPVLDDLDRVIDHARTQGESDPLLAGAEMVRAKAIEVLRRFGLEVIVPQGEAFDPAVHQAVARQPSAGAAPMTVLAVAEKGYMLKGRLVRPAKVVVAVEPAGSDNIPFAADQPFAGQADAPKADSRTERSRHADLRIRL